MYNKQRIVVGIDEAGRGALAGPVVAAALMFSPTGLENLQKNLRFLGDSKKLSSRQREIIFQALKDMSGIAWEAARASEKEIDSKGIGEASKLAMARALIKLEEKTKLKANLVLIDGNIRLPVKRKQKGIIRGDAKIPQIKLASVAAKVFRDKIMRHYAKKYFFYGFDKHKGYGTEEHIKAIVKFGPCPIHRKSFTPISLLLEK